MVVAEVPLWVVHSTSASGTEGISSQNAAVGGNPLDGPIGRANESLSLLENLGGGNSKAAIYSIDTHPDGTSFATGGGDGAVRIWNSVSLFAKNRGQFSQGTYQSSGAESMSEGGMASASDAGEESNLSDSAPSEEVHDLNQLVRRKKDGSTPVKKPSPVENGGSMAPPPSMSMQTSPSSSRRFKKDSHHHRLLCTLSAHTGSSVLAVRFSHSGQYLASAGDDAVVCIYQKSTSTSSGNLEQHSPSIENWTRIKICRGHTLDVVGLAWAPDDSHLVSCSLDSDAPIIVWKLTSLGNESSSQILCNPYKVLGKNEHSSTVKGVTFDPAGTYLASSGDDPAVCIWRAHDDWGLEKKIDDGIFRKWKEDDVQQLSSQTLFRRLSWSTDGTYICSTNATVKNKHVASTISREGWSVSCTQSAAAGAANLVGHKQPVVVSRHCPRLLDARKGTTSENSSNDDDDDEPDYATLVALGDKRGFVTVWSTRKSRPIFKLQCSESRCTVTDLAWGRVPNGNDLILLVSLLDGNVVALKFGVPSELGPLLSDSMQNRVFQLRYGLDFDDDVGLGRRRMFVGDSSGPKLVENALQIALEEQEEEEDDNVDGEGDQVMEDASSSDDNIPISQLGSPRTVKSQQSETEVKGKKRIRPVLMNTQSDAARDKRNKATMNGDNGKKKKKKSSDPTIDALESAAKAASAAEGISGASPKRTSQKGPSAGVHTEQIPGSRQHGHPHRPPPVTPFVTQIGAPQIPHSTSRIHSFELPLPPDSATDMGGDNGDTHSAKITADCTNTMQTPKGSSGQPVSCAVLTISRDGKALWKDEITGSSCSAIAGTQKVLAVGTADGAVYLYGTSPGLGWLSVMAVRSHPPLIFGQAIVSLQLKENTNSNQIEMLVVTSDGSFGVYTLIPELKLCFKGSIMPAMTHMILSSFGAVNNDTVLPKLARVQITDSNHLLMILSLQTSSSRTDQSRNNTRSTSGTSSVGVGGGLQGFVYKRSMELWMRVADSRFVLSDFYSTLPSKTASSSGIMSKVEDAVKSGSASSSLKPSHRGRDGHSSAMFQNAEGSNGASYIVTRSHCEDRMACAAALGSVDEFKRWFSLYIQTLSKGGHVDQLRLLADMLLDYSEALATHSWWWLSLAPAVLNLDRKDVIRSIVIPEMSKNRALQRVTNEIAMQLDLG